MEIVRPNRMKRKLMAKQPVFGVNLSLLDPELVEIAGATDQRGSQQAREGLEQRRQHAGGIAAAGGGRGFALHPGARNQGVAAGVSRHPPSGERGGILTDSHHRRQP